MMLENYFAWVFLSTIAMILFIGGLVGMVLAAERWSPWAEPVPTATPVPTVAPTPLVSETSSITRPLNPTPTATNEPEEPIPTQKPSRPIAGGNFAALPLPDGTTSIRGIASDGATYPYCFYWAPTHEIVLVDGCNEQNRIHEYMHAHQHWSINGGAPLRPSDYDLESWYATAEGRSFTAMTAGLPWPWSRSAVSGLEDFAWTATFWYIDPGRLATIGGQARYEWARENLP